LLQAIPNIIKKFPKAVFLLIGTGPLKAEMEELCQDLNIIEHVRFTGYRTDVPKLLQLMDILVIPSVKEGFPFVLLEGAYASRPIVATQVGGVSELIDNGVSGILVPPKDSLALSEAIVYLLENPELARSLGQMAQKKVMSNFSVETMAKQTELLYDRLIARKLVNQR
jgi:glycosyltransferase involved in cell wall biosynthesis